MSDFENTEIFGEMGEDGRPANVPEKYWQAGEGEDQASIDVGGLLTEYNYRTKQIGAADGMFGAPEEAYSVPEYELPEGVEYTLADDDPLLMDFSEFAKANNLSDKAYGDIVKFYINNQAQQVQATQAFQAGELDKLGANGKGKEMVEAFTQQVENWTKDLPEEQRTAMREGAKDALYSANSYKFLAFMADRSQPNALPASDSTANGGINAAKIREMQNAIIEEGPQKGRRRYEVDKEYRAEVQALREQVIGTGEQREEVNMRG